VHLLTGWGRTAPTASHLVSAADPDEVRATLSSAGGRGVIARGLGRSYGDPAQNAGGTVLMPLPPSIVIAPDAETVRVSAGTSLHDLMTALLPRGRFLPVSPGTRWVSVGGAVACDVHGKSHHRAGTFGRHVASMSLMTADGRVHEIGPEDDPELFWATVGGLGLTGVLLEATLRTIPVQSAWITATTRRTDDLDDTMTVLREADDDVTYSVAWIDTLARGRALGRSVVSLGEHARLDELTGAAARRPWLLPGTPRLGVAGPVPPHLVSWPTVRAFNELWYRKAPRLRQGELQTIGSFFHPLDAVAGWNRLYGARGFVQYQLVVPDTEPGDGALRAAVTLVASLGQGSFLSVLKRFGAENPGLLSFPMPGWTLALDLPVGPGLGEVLDRLDGLVTGVGGRVYLAKDARLQPATLRAMYPRLDAFREVRDRVDPHRLFTSDLSRRLDL
jgi:decaprenylphospho-beta-D-ribofuranose 2-oxidase